MLPLMATYLVATPGTDGHLIPETVILALTVVQVSCSILCCLYYILYCGVFAVKYVHLHSNTSKRILMLLYLCCKVSAYSVSVLIECCAPWLNILLLKSRLI